MSSVTPIAPAGALTPANAYSKHSSAVASAPKPPPAEPRPEPRPLAAPAAPGAAEHHHAASPTASTTLSAQALSSTDVSYVESLLGALPAQRMEEILLKTGVPIPANLGPNVDTAA